MSIIVPKVNTRRNFCNIFVCVLGIYVSSANKNNIVKVKFCRLSIAVRTGHYKVTMKLSDIHKYFNDLHFGTALSIGNPSISVAMPVRLTLTRFACEQTLLNTLGIYADSSGGGASAYINCQTAATSCTGSAWAGEIKMSSGAVTRSLPLIRVIEGQVAVSSVPLQMLICTYQPAPGACSTKPKIIGSASPLGTVFSNQSLFSIQAASAVYRSSRNGSPESDSITNTSYWNFNIWDPSVTSTQTTTTAPPTTGTITTRVSPEPVLTKHVDYVTQTTPTTTVTEMYIWPPKPFEEYCKQPVAITSAACMLVMNVINMIGMFTFFYKAYECKSTTSTAFDSMGISYSSATAIFRSSTHKTESRDVIIGRPDLNTVWYPQNVTCNQKYNIITFIPLVLFEQFNVFFNLYFLIMACTQFVPSLRINYLYTYWVPLSCVTFASMLREGYEDIKRAYRDREINSQRYTLLTENGHREEILSSEIKVSDIIILRKNQRVPADILLLQTLDKS
ncbi:unnamed protein product, partial [Rotaria socialis]